MLLREKEKSIRVWDSRERLLNFWFSRMSFHAINWIPYIIFWGIWKVECYELGSTVLISANYTFMWPWIPSVVKALSLLWLLDILLDWIGFTCYLPLYERFAADSFMFLVCVICRNLTVALCLVLYHCVILSIWSLQMKTSIRALTMSMTGVLQVLSATFSRSNPLLH